MSKQQHIHVETKLRKIDNSFFSFQLHVVVTVLYRTTI